MRLIRAAAVLVLFASSLNAQQVTVGQLPPYAPSTLSLGGANFPLSLIDFSHPANAAGTVSRATVYWSNHACSNAFKLVFVRPNNSLAFFTVVGARGPFNAVVGRNDLTLSPPVSVLQGDLIAVVQLQSQAACGAVLTSVIDHGDTGGAILTNADVSVGGGAGTVTSLSPGTYVAAIAYGSDPVLVRVLPVGGAVQGVTAFFRTAVQIVNEGNETITGKFVFHKAGQSAAPTDPSLPISIAAGRSTSIPDIVAAMGVSGLGSIDVMTDRGAVPIVTARVFSDGGSAGTSGFTEEALKPTAALGPLDNGVLQMPSDLTNFRMNIGIRTLSDGAVLDVSWAGSNGALQGATTLTYGPNFFEQKTANQFTGAATLDPDGWIYIHVQSGDAFIYETVTDNRTSDSAIRFATTK